MGNTICIHNITGDILTVDSEVLTTILRAAENEFIARKKIDGRMFPDSDKQAHQEICRLLFELRFGRLK